MATRVSPSGQKLRRDRKASEARLPQPKAPWPDGAQGRAAQAPETILVTWTKGGRAAVATPASAGSVRAVQARYVRVDASTVGGTGPKTRAAEGEDAP